MTLPRFSDQPVLYPLLNRMRRREAKMDNTGPNEETSDSEVQITNDEIEEIHELLREGDEFRDAVGKLMDPLLEIDDIDCNLRIK